MADEPGRMAPPNSKGVYTLSGNDIPEVVFAKQMTRIEMNVDQVMKDVAEVKAQLNSQYVSREAHQNLADKVAVLTKIVYGAVGILLTAILVAVAKVVIK